MLPQLDSIRKYFAKLGLQPEIADLYLALYTYGPQNISSLAKNSRVERTRIYRLVDQLLESNLIEMELSGKPGIIKAAPIANIKILITQKEHELSSLRDDLELVELALARNTISSPAVRVQMYYGVEGIKQMLDNITRSKSIVLAVENRTILDMVKHDYYTKWSEKIKSSNIIIKYLPSDSNLDLNTYIYDDVTCYINTLANELYATELHNQFVAAQYNSILNPSKI
jgi:sugar-specific transcriptional regulator TrmB